MANFLALCQKTARESGTIEGVLPSTVVGQSGRLLKVVNWVNREAAKAAQQPSQYIMG